MSVCGDCTMLWSLYLNNQLVCQFTRRLRKKYYSEISDFGFRMAQKGLKWSKQSKMVQILDSRTVIGSVLIEWSAQLGGSPQSWRISTCGLGVYRAHCTLCTVSDGCEDGKVQVLYTCGHVYTLHCAWWVWGLRMVECIYCTHAASIWVRWGGQSLKPTTSPLVAP